jgi:hypothetical protein
MYGLLKCMFIKLVLWSVRPCGSVRKHECFGGKYCHNLQGRTSRGRQQTPSKILYIVCQNIRHHITEDQYISKIFMRTNLDSGNIFVMKCILRPTWKRLMGLARTCTGTVSRASYGRIEGRIQVTWRRGIRRKYLPEYDLKQTRGHWKLKEEAPDGTLWRTGFGRDSGPVVRREYEIHKWKKHWPFRKNRMTSFIMYYDKQNAQIISHIITLLHVSTLSCHPQPVINTLPSYTSISNAAVGNTIYNYDVSHRFYASSHVIVITGIGNRLV